MDQQQQAGQQANNQQVSASADADDSTADPRAATAQTQATARMAQAFQANMDQQLKIHQNVEKSIDV